MPRLDGMQLIEEVQKRRLPVDVIVMTGYGSIDEAVQAMRLGAFDFLTKPIDLEHLRLVVQRALRERRCRTRWRRCASSCTSSTRSTTSSARTRGCTRSSS